MKAESMKLDELRAESREISDLEDAVWAVYDDAFALRAKLHDMGIAVDRANTFLLDEAHKTWHAEEAVWRAREALKEVAHGLGARRAALWTEERDEIQKLERESAS